MDIEQARIKALCHHMTTISIDNKPFVPLIKVKRSEALLAGHIRVMLSKRRSNRIHYFLQTYSNKITLINAD
ncbi:hypothetical protein [Colwellia psychrerythraea]|uniref:Uncharacterized protein n=1 Tax=Colwellia psychrerythraea TaxID=28229 RepID=A0A099KV51_COLPS|nr:hypothetical protein [Colwellia psychrerythraea]KGJ93722.1 hypothetical protein ND2E_2215 [Colwellia psychrerythraea]